MKQTNVSAVHEYEYKALVNEEKKEVFEEKPTNQIPILYLNTSIFSIIGKPSHALENRKCIIMTSTFTERARGVIK
jgi:hypothetical protein